MEQFKFERRFDLDWLRVLAFSLLIFYHSSLVFTKWIVSNGESSKFLLNFAYSVSQWRMPLICIIAGGGVFFAFQKHVVRSFLEERFRRLVIPLIFGVLFITAPQMYFNRLFNGQKLPSYFDFQLSVFQFRNFPKGNFNWCHLWFIGYLFLYCIMALPLFTFLRNEKGKRMLSKVSTFTINRKWSIILLVIPLIILDIIVGLFWNPNGSKFGSLFIYFLYGYIFFTEKNTLMLLQEFRKKFLLFGIVTGAAVLLVGEKSGFGDVYSTEIPIVFAKLLKNLNVLIWVCAIVGYGRQYLNFNHKILKYANEAVYPFYILHQTVLIVLAYYVIQLNAGIALKFGIISIGTFAISLIIYEFLIRRSNILRFLFGLKPLKSESRPIIQQSPAAMEVSPLLETTQKAKQI